MDYKLCNLNMFLIYQLYGKYALYTISFNCVHLYLCRYGYVCMYFLHLFVLIFDMLQPVSVLHESY